MALPDSEHRAIDQALAEVEFYAQRHAFGLAANHFMLFRKTLEAHLDVEQTHDPRVMQPEIQAQHRELAAALERLGAALARHDYGEFSAGLGPLVRQLAEHQRTEERLLAPAGTESAR